MPYTKRPVRRSRPGYRKYKRTKAKGKGSGYSVTAAEKVFPTTKSVAFTYVQELDMLAGAGASVTDSFRSNSLYDPYAGGIGSQPRYYDTLVGANNTTAPYHQYAVAGVKAEAFMRNTSANHMFVAITMASATTSAPTSLAEARERPDTVVRVSGPLGSANTIAKLSMYRSNGKILGYKDLMDTADMKAVYNSNPGFDGRVYITAFNPDGATSSRVKVSVKLTYYSRLFISNDVADS